MPFRFLTNDDTIMMLLVSGRFSGIPEDYAVYLHPFLSVLLANLYEIDAQVHWYPILWFLFFYFAFIGWTRVIVKKAASFWPQLAFVLAFLSFALHYLLFLQFTVVSGVLAFAGYFLILLRYQQKRVNKWDIILGYTLCVLSFLVRKDSFFIITVAFGIMVWIQFHWKGLVQILLDEKVLIVTIGILWVATPAFELFMGYQDYAEFNRARSKVLDHPALYGINVKEMWGQDGFFFRNWYFRDNPGINTGQLEKWRKELNVFYFQKEHLFQALNFFKHQFISYKFMGVLAAVFLALNFSLGKVGRKAGLFLIIWAAIMFVVNYFFLLHARVIALFILMVLGLAVFFYEEKSKHKVKALIFSIVFFLISVVHFFNFKEGLPIKKEQVVSQQELMDLIPTKKIVFMDWVSLDVLHTDPKRANIPVDVFYFGWNNYHPAEKRLLNNLGYNNLKEVEEFYFLHHINDDKMLVPQYLTYLNGPYKMAALSKNEFFELLYFYKEQTDL